MIGAFQFVFRAWNGMIESGDRDRCYYNDFCYRVSDYDIPFNLMISNLVYLIHGIILAFSVSWMEAELLAWCHRPACDRRSESPLPEGQIKLPEHCIECPCIDAHLANMSVPRSKPANDENAILLDAEAYNRKYTFSIGYSLAWALIFEGCFSTVYHFCPEQLTFQFDSAFMFVISGLIVVSLYNGTSFKECAVHGKVQLPVHSNNFFLFFIIPPYIFNYFGLLYSSDEITFGVAMFIICVVAYYLILIIWAGIKLFGNVSCCRGCSLLVAVPFLHEGNGGSESVQESGQDPDVITKRALFIIVVISVAIVVPLKFVFRKDFPSIFLFGCISTSLLAIFSKLIVQFCRSGLSHCTFLQFLYAVATFGIMSTAVWIFMAKATTDKEKSSWESRDLNHNCFLLGFFDYHDLWHILSSFALSMGAYCVLDISK